MAGMYAAANCVRQVKKPAQLQQTKGSLVLQLEDSKTVGTKSGGVFASFQGFTDLVGGEKRSVFVLLVFLPDEMHYTIGDWSSFPSGLKDYRF